MSKNTNGLSKKATTPSGNSPKQKPPKLSKPSVSVMEAEKSPKSAKANLTNGCPKSNSFDVRERSAEQTESQDKTKYAVNHTNGKFDTNIYKYEKFSSRNCERQGCQVHQSSQKQSSNSS